MRHQTNDRSRHPAPTIAVVGGGISGLAAAHRLHELQPDAQIVLIEASPRLGGVLQSQHQDGFLIEQGADNFITTPPWAVQFCERIGFADQLIPTNSVNRKAFVVSKGRLREIPAGFAVMAPGRIWPIISTPILSPFAKLRMAAEVFVAASKSDAEESLAAFVRRRFGREVYERLVQPLVGGIYTGDPEKLSVGATMPRFLDMEREAGSLIRAIWRQRKAQRQVSASASGARYSQFMAPRDGMSAFVEAIASKLQTEILLESPVKTLQQTAGGGWDITIGGPQPQTLQVDGLVLATPAQGSAKILETVDTEMSDAYRKIKYGSCALVSMAFQRDQIEHALDGFGFVVPAVENRQILSASFSSIKYAHRAPDGHVLIRAYVGGALQAELVELSDQRLQQLVAAELKDLIQVRGTAKLCHITRQIQAMPQYHVGHEAIAQQIEARAEQLSNFALAGNALRGIGIPNCISTGAKAAEDLVEQFTLSDPQSNSTRLPVGLP